MENRKMIQECIEKISKKINELTDIVNNTSDESLKDLLEATFWDFGTNIEVNLNYMELLITRKFDDESGESQKLMTDDELHNYFKENIYQLIGDFI